MTDPTDSTLNSRRLQQSFTTGRPWAGSSQNLTHSNLKIQGVGDDMKDEQLMAFVAAIDLLYLRVTGPYWELLQSDTKYTELHHYVKDLSHAVDRQVFFSL